MCKAAERRSIQEQCAQIEAQALQMERDAHSLREQQKGILGLRRTVVREGFKTETAYCGTGPKAPFHAGPTNPNNDSILELAVGFGML